MGAGCGYATHAMAKGQYFFFIFERRLIFERGGAYFSNKGFGLLAMRATVQAAALVLLEGPTRGICDTSAYMGWSLLDPRIFLFRSLAEEPCAVEEDIISRLWGLFKNLFLNFLLVRVNNNLEQEPAKTR